MNGIVGFEVSFTLLRPRVWGMASFTLGFAVGLAEGHLAPFFS